jgi:hypothetical protein
MRVNLFVKSYLWYQQTLVLKLCEYRGVGFLGQDQVRANDDAQHFARMKTQQGTENLIEKNPQAQKPPK